jgi:nanoRNase/pAp phosphatase (c-di-AMP/oligoRNAs hydrolase)
MADLKESPAQGLAALAGRLSPHGPVLVQTHDFPDLDAVASAWSLGELLRRRGFSVECVYRGTIRSRSLSRLVEELSFALTNREREEKDAGSQIVVVDGSPSNGNVQLFPGKLIGVIDHHCSTALPSAPYIDIRPELAACSTIIEGYWRDSGEELPRALATALIAGIQSDTDFLSRRASAEDFAAYTALFARGDFELASRIVRTVFDLTDLDLVTKALGAATIKGGIFWAWMPGPCSQEVLAVLAEFVLRTEELRVAIVAERGVHLAPNAGGFAANATEDGVHLSVRSKDPRLSAFALVKAALMGIGSGGGHDHSAGGFVPDSNFCEEAALRERFFAIAREFPA